MKQFDYARAWREIAKPAFESLPANVRELVERTSMLSNNLAQEKDLTMPWPPADDFRAAFENLPLELLAKASRIVYCYGHWAPERIPEQTTGVYWKFSHYCDQVIRKRLNVPHGENPLGISFRVHEGIIWVCSSTPDSWQWRETYLAGPGTLNRLETFRQTAPSQLVKLRKSRASWREYESQIDAWLEQAVKCARDGETEPFVLALLTAGETYQTDDGR